jgi:hypothetical protein
MNIITTAGPGHTLNELINRLVTIAIQPHTRPDRWQLYPGPLGLYARHSDDYGFGDHQELCDFYNKKLRCPGPESKYEFADSDLDWFQLMMERAGVDQLALYFNTISVPLLQRLLPHTLRFTAKMDLPNSPHRHHHLMMEYSTGAADSVDYSKPLNLELLARRLIKKDRSEKQLLEQLDGYGYHVIDINQILSGDIDPILAELPGVDDKRQQKMLEEIQKYLFINQCSHPTLITLNETPWEFMQDYLHEDY